MRNQIFPASTVTHGQKAKRDSESHRRDANKTLKATSSSQRKKLESTLGVRYTESLRLPYYDCVRFVVIDPIHNLLLGTAKCLFHKWIELGLLKQDDLNKIQNHINEIVVPPDIGRIPNKIESGSSGMTAEELDAGIFAIHFIHCIAKNTLRLLMIFVAACRLMCARTISRHELKGTKFVSLCRKLYRGSDLASNTSTATLIFLSASQMRGPNRLTNQIV